MFETEKNLEHLILIGVVKDSHPEQDDYAEQYLKELAMLAETAGAVVAGYMIQARPQPHPTRYLGKGKLEELKVYAEAIGATGILCDDELSGSQLKNVDDALGMKVLDRTMIILDIFAERAMSAEGKAQVELAQLKYRLSRLIGIGAQLSRQGGTAAGGAGGAGGVGIGARGPGEKKLETDRRHIQSRIKQLNEELQDITTSRKVLRDRRIQTGVPIIALVGYTNAGKSTLLNSLTDANVLAEDKLFATLDTTTRKLELPGGASVLITDTVGFINKLPHHLVQAFRATLEELQYATILLHVVDASNPDYREQITVVHNTLKDLKCMDKPMITAYNKADLSNNYNPGEFAIGVSAKTGGNLSALLESCEKVLQSMRRKLTVIIPYKEGHLVSLIHNNCEIITEAHVEEGTKIEAYIPEELYGQLTSYTVVSGA
ncbi:MAG: GTPase HflX [Defluviitaleaceae bacterium]|nr:GTPase HflX [Defluviitaleaceae bacterium]